MLRLALLALAFLAPFLAPAPAQQKKGNSLAAENEFVERYFAAGEAALAAGKPDEARAAWAKVLEREPRHLPTLSALAALEKDANQLDLALDYAGRFLDIWRYLKQKPQGQMARQQELYGFVHTADPLRRRLDSLRREYVSRLLKLANEQMDHLAWHSARAMLSEAQFTDPEHPELAAGLERIRKEGGNELAVADETGGSDPLAGVTPEWVAKNDPLHSEWDTAWELETEHYKVKTDAGYRVLMTAARAMEQVQVFYRLFHQYKTKNEKIPIAGVWIFKNHDEFMTLGKPSVTWAAGFWNGSEVVTFDPRGEGSTAGLTDLLDVLFHEASHQFTSLAGGGSVPAWLNEGMASFFEGTRLLSNGKLDWNLVASGRLYPLVDDIKAGTHKLADVIQGNVEDYRVFYPWGWGIVYYLFNAEDAQGHLIYRASMRDYFQKYSTDQHLARFTEFFVTNPKVEGVATIEDFEKRFKQWILDLADADRGKIDVARKFEERGDQQVRLGDWKRAVELYDRSLERDPDYPEVLWKLAAALEQTGETDRAAGILRQWLTVMAPGFLDGSADVDTLKRRADAQARIPKLDTSAKQLAEIRVKFHGDSLLLASDYDKAGLPRMALRVLRGPATAEPPSERAREMYFAIADKSGVSLESWRLIFNERDLKGFYGGGEGDFQVEDGVLVASIKEDSDNANKNGPTTGSAGGADAAAARPDLFAFRRLFVDVEPAGDWSLSAEVLLDKSSTLAGLCFGKKADGRFCGVGLLPKGYVDLATLGASDGKPLTRNKVDLLSGWNKLRVDVAGTRVVVTLNGNEVVDYLFETRAEIRGGFGLLAGLGKASFREIKVLEYDPSLPRRTKIGWRKPVPEYDAESGKMSVQRSEPGKPNYLNQAPPKLDVEGWVGDVPMDGDLDRLLGWPVLLVFWTPDQEKVLPQLPGIDAIAEKYAALKIPILLLCNQKKETVEAWGSAHALRYPVCYDWSQKLYKSYAIDKVQLPHAKLIGMDGLVAWEGNPDWKAEFGSYLDEPFADMVKKGRLAELGPAREKLTEIEARMGKGERAGIADELQAIVGLGVEHPVVARAKVLVARIELEAAGALEAAEAKFKEGRFIQGVAALQAVEQRYSGVAQSGEAKKRAEKRIKEKGYLGAKKLENRLRITERHLAAGKFDDAKESLGVTVSKLEAGADPWLTERVHFLEQGLAASTDAKALYAEYKSFFPGAIE
ncbi:MAG: tetratricopeptide repeat protein [Planctomycetes bacterium]|nr:tetratricopeptide repeat protein [Planctomycetota bacterium]